MIVIIKSVVSKNLIAKVAHNTLEHSLGQVAPFVSGWIDV